MFQEKYASNKRKISKFSCPYKLLNGNQCKGLAIFAIYEYFTAYKIQSYAFDLFILALNWLGLVQ